MKHKLPFLAIVLIIAAAAIPGIAPAQNEVGVFRAYPLYPLATVTGSDTSDAVSIPYSVGKLVAYTRVDSLSASDTLKVFFQGSSDLVQWFTVDSTAAFVAIGGERKIFTTPDLYMRTVNQVVGTSVRIRLKTDFVTRP